MFINVKFPTGQGTQITVKEYPIDYCKELIKNPKRLALAICFIPRSLGGYPVCQVSDLIMQGFPGPVSSEIWECKKLFGILPPHIDYLKTALICALKRITTSRSNIKRMVLKYIPNMPGIENEAIKLFFAQSQKEQKTLTSVLYSMEPLHPRVMASIYESTPTGVLLKR